MSETEGRRYSKVAEAVFGDCWDIVPSKLEAIAEIIDLRVAGGVLSAEDIDARTGKGRAKFGAVKGSVGVLPVYGVIMQHAGMMNDISGGTSTDTLGAEFDQMMASTEIGAVVLDVDSPGGSVYGLEELSDKIYAARGTKPIIAVANSMAASAAYYIASAADEIVATPGGEVGSIGTVAIHTDVSAADEQEGIKRTILKQGKYKTDGNPYEPLSDDARGTLQASIDRYYNLFVNAVARNRGTTPLQVKRGYGEGKLVGAQEGLELGMVDRIGTLEEVVGRLAGATRPKKTGMRAEAAARELELEEMARGGNGRHK
jgi:signal peptide peptidase SppA